MVKAGKHRAFEVDLKSKVVDGEAQVLPSDAVELSLDLATFFEQFVKDLRFCSVCGEIQPELHFIYKSKRYRFVCYRITENNKVVAETDYYKLAHYLHPYTQIKKQKTRK